MHLQTAMNMTINVNLTSYEHRAQAHSMLRTMTESQLWFSVSANKRQLEKIREKVSWEYNKIKLLSREVKYFAPFCYPCWNKHYRENFLQELLCLSTDFEW